MARPQSALLARKRRGDYPTPAWLVDAVVEHALPAAVASGQRVSVLDPACGDGRFLVAAARRLIRAGARPVLVGVDIDATAVHTARQALAGFATVEVRVERGDALTMAWGERRFDVVVGNPPFLSQMAASTTRGGASRHGGGPYADVAAEFMALSVRLARPGGRVGLVLPQSILAARDASPVRAEVDRLATVKWSWWSPQFVFDAHVVVCALVWELRREPLVQVPARSWSHVVTGALDIPAFPPVTSAGTLGERARLSANFRDHYYGLIPSVVDGGMGPPLITSGLVDPGRCRWGSRPVTFARRRFGRPTVELDRLAPTMRRWAEDLLTPKVLVANQTRVIEAVTDPDGRWLPGVPLITVRPADGVDAVEIAAVLTSPVASAWAWHRAGGTGLSARTLRLGPRWLAELPWPRGDLAPAVAALQSGDVAACGEAVSAAYGTAATDPTLHCWWLAALPTDGPT